MANVNRNLNPATRYGIRTTLLAAALLLVAVPFGLLLAQVTTEGWLTKIDTAAANELHEKVVDSPTWVTVLQIISFLGSPVWFYGVIGLVVGYLGWRGRWRLAAFLVTTGLLGGIIDTVVKVVVDRDRPSLDDPVATAHGQSFPSGHSMTSLVCYGALLVVFLPAIPQRARRWVMGSAAALVLAIGLSRLGLGVHYISDVLGGFTLGAAWLLASVASFGVWRKETGKPKADAIDEGIEPEAAADLQP